MASKIYLPQQPWTWCPPESVPAPHYPACYPEKWQAHEAECPRDPSTVACYHCKKISF